ncbi:MAG: GTPase ObgE [Armatimonadota bacterium]
MFVDEVTIEVEGGKGGDGMVGFRREPYVPRGGPNGGDGGDGGDVILEARANLTTLLDFKYQSRFRAEHGRPGGTNNRTGRRGTACVVHVPVGTVVYDAASGRVLGDLNEDEERLVVARGGEGGRGNARFATATRRTPKFAEKGLAGQSRALRLELKLIADVGVVGFPNAGKSSLIARVSAARPKVADYPFTTLVPNLGVVAGPDGRSLVMADMPGLIEGAHQGVGLGHQFLRHIERTRVLIHLLDGDAPAGRDPVSDYRALNRELALHDERLTQLPQIVALNKVDLPHARELAPLVQEELADEAGEVLLISAATGEGVRDLTDRAFAELERARAEPSPFAVAAEAEPEPEERPLMVKEAEEGVFAVSGTAAERAVARTNLDSEPALYHLHAELDRLGVLSALERAGAQHGDTIRIGDAELEYVLGLRDEEDE